MSDELPLDNQVQIILQADGNFVKRLPPKYTPLGDCSDLMSKLFCDKPFFFSCLMDDISIYAYPNGNTTAIMELPKLVLNTHWELFTDSGRAYMCPRWKSDETSVAMILDWIPPSDMKLLLCHAFSSGAIPAKPFLLALCAQTGRAHSLPLSNLYENAEICLGADSERIHDYSSVCGFMTQVKQVLDLSNWNLDLPPPSTYYRDLFRYNDKKEQTFKSGKWQSRCSVVSSYQYNGAIEAYNTHHKIGVDI